MISVLIGAAVAGATAQAQTPAPSPVSASTHDASETSTGSPNLQGPTAPRTSLHPVSRGIQVHTASASPPKTAIKPKKRISKPPSQLNLQLEVGLVLDPDFPDLSEAVIGRALKSAAKTFAQRFNVTPPRFVVTSSLSVRSFLASASHDPSPHCRRLLSARYRGTGPQEFKQHRKAAIKFLKRWPLKSVLVFIPAKERSSVKNHTDLFERMLHKYVATIDRLKLLKTANGSSLVEPNTSTSRSFAAWLCALSAQSRFDVVITNSFIMADVMNEPHPHAFFGKAKIGGIAGQNQNRTALSRSALLATSFGIDTEVSWLSELGGVPATERERASILGDYLIAHEVAHAVFGIPDMFDHPSECLMTSRPNETYREGLRLLEKNPRACAKCKKWVLARSYLDRARNQLAKGRAKTALRLLARASKATPKHFHGRYKKRMAEISLLVSKAYIELNRAKRGKRFAKRALALDPKSPAAKLHWQVLTSTTAAD
jgi:hypothetical protein